MRRFYCVLGDPVAHSRSPAIHARAFARLGLDAVFAPCRVTAAELPAAVSGLRSLGCAGFNVTVPHKTAVAGLVDRLEGDAARIAAVNCVAPQGTALVGHNTDTAGLLRALRQHGIDPSGKAVVVGAGGSARAAAFALAGRASSVAILNRTEARAAESGRSRRGALCRKPRSWSSAPRWDSPTTRYRSIRRSSLQGLRWSISSTAFPAATRSSCAGRASAGSAQSTASTCSSTRRLPRSRSGSGGRGWTISFPPCARRRCREPAPLPHRR
ncbi:MAG: hypothetical protein E6J85_19550 [Deltaproteobacteria bacterium]|nr:MAG: hypothetical protein E6J85_19550 [Deltaproteobacteria bacterium]